MLLSQLLYGIEIIETNITDTDIEISSVSADSRRVETGDLFIAMAGNSYNGHGYIGQALERGAAVIVTEERSVSDRRFPYIRVYSTRAAYALIYNNLCRRPAEGLRLIGVTGTNGKSSTVAMITHMLRGMGRQCESIGTLDGGLTTPDPPQLYPRLRELADRGIEYVVMECSSHALHYRKLEPLTFEYAVFTNLTPEHLDLHGDMDGYAGAKSLLFDKCRIAIYNKDDRYADAVTGRSEKRVSYSFTDDSADYICRNIRLSPKGTEIDLLSSGELFRISTPLIGVFNAYNLTAAATLARVMGVSPEDIKRSMATMPTVKGRLERVELARDDFTVYIDYAHTPDALAKVLTTLRQIHRGRLICVFGCGGQRDRTKRAPMGTVASALADMTVITSDNPRGEDPYEIIRDILCGIDEHRPRIVIPDRRGAIRYVIHSARCGDVIVFCGKGHEKYEITPGGKTPFDEIKLIQDAEKERIGKEGNEYYPR